MRAFRWATGLAAAAARLAVLDPATACLDVESIRGDYTTRATKEGASGALVR